MSKSILRINEDIQRELSALLRNIKDPRINQGMISITSVNTTSDLSQAKVYLSVYDLKSKPEFMKGLKSASGHLRYELGKALSLRHTPQLLFELDASLERGAKIASILNSLDIPPDESDGETGGSEGADGDATIVEVAEGIAGTGLASENTAAVEGVEITGRSMEVADE